MAERLSWHAPTRVEDFVLAAGPFLEAREALHCLTLGICSDLQAFPDGGSQPPRFGIVTADRDVVLTVVWTPPWQAVLSSCDDFAAISVAVEGLAGATPIGVHGPIAAARAFAEAWAAKRGAKERIYLRERVYELADVARPHGVPGALRHIRPSDRDHLIGWLIAFEEETFGERQPRDPGAMVDRALSGEGRRLYVWDDDGPVSLCGVGGLTPNGIRIGPVYTPPGLRGRGYASACVAATSQGQLDAGRRRCYLFTDVANPTSNHVYQAIGYRPVGDVDIYRVD